MHGGSERPSESRWAEAVSLKIWAAPISQGGVLADERQSMSVEREGRRGLQGYLAELWDRLRCLAQKARVYTKLKQV